jgi:hypothetical protein
MTDPIVKNLRHLAIVLLVAGTVVLSGPLGRLVAFGFFLVAYGFCMLLERVGKN